MKKILISTLVVLFALTGCNNTKNPPYPTGMDIPNHFEQPMLGEGSPYDNPSLLEPAPVEEERVDLGDGFYVDTYSGEAAVEVNDGVPFFTEEEMITVPFEIYAELDELGRCGTTYANICKELMPTEERGEIGHVKPTGWETIKYDCIDGKYLYNRCHLIGYQLSGENANERNLITGTRYLNIEGMLPFENQIADYVKMTGNHVLYRVTPIFQGDNLLAHGVLMEGYSVEDAGEGISFCVFAYNVQPGIEIDYTDGSSHLIEDKTQLDIITNQYTANEEGIVYILNTSSNKYHCEDCKYAERISEKNRETFNGTVQWLSDNGYKPCGICKPK